MKILLIKMSSLGDVVHTLPAVTDLFINQSDVQLDWIVEPAFADIIRQYQKPINVLEFPFRTLRQHFIQNLLNGKWQGYVNLFKNKSYDIIIDAQGLLKSALLTRWISGETYGYDKFSAREGIASWFYQHKVNVPRSMHAINRSRALFSNIFGYDVDLSTIDYGLEQAQQAESFSKTIIFLHATTWVSKKWPITKWRALAAHIQQYGYQVKLPWGNEAEKKVAEEIAAGFLHVNVMPRMPLNELIPLLAKSAGIVSVDTGLAHILNAYQIPQVILFGPTNSVLTGLIGPNCHNIQSQKSCSPCLKRDCSVAQLGQPSVCLNEMNVTQVWQYLEKKIKQSQRALDLEAIKE